MSLVEYIGHDDTSTLTYNGLRYVGKRGEQIDVPAALAAALPADWSLATGGVGPKGDKGDTGAAGTNGTNGAAGANGTNGTNGTNGADATSLIAANTQTASYTLVLSDGGKSVEMNSASATVLTIPPNSSVAFPIGTTIEICRIGAGSVTITDGAGVTIPNRVEAAGTTSRTIANQWSSAAIRKRATDQWVLVGDIA